MESTVPTVKGAVSLPDSWGGADPRHHHLVGHQYPPGRGGLAGPQGGGHGAVVVGQGRRRAGSAARWAARTKGQQGEFHRAVAVLQHDLAGRAGVNRPARCTPWAASSPAAKSSRSALSWFACDGQHRNAPPRQLGQEPVQQRAGRRRRHRGVVDIPRQQHGLHVVLITQGQHLFQNVALVLQQIEPVHPFAQVQVRQMQKFSSGHLQSFSQVVMSSVTPGSTSTGTVSALRETAFLAEHLGFQVPGPHLHVQAAPAVPFRQFLGVGHHAAADALAPGLFLQKQPAQAERSGRSQVHGEIPHRLAAEINEKIV